MLRREHLPTQEFGIVATPDRSDHNVSQVLPRGAPGQWISPCRRLGATGPPSVVLANPTLSHRRIGPMLDWLDIMTRLCAAAAIGGAIGLNRYAHHKPTGLRTLSLVATGAAGLVLATLHTGDGALHIDAMSRVIQ